MNPWVQPFLISRWEPSGTVSYQAYLAEINVSTFAYERLVNCFSHNIENLRIIKLLGETLSRVPEQVFRELLNLGLFLNFPERLGQIRVTNPGIEITLSSELLTVWDSIVIGVSVHEIGHAYLRHCFVQFGDRTRQSLEAEAWKLCEEWGFTYEVKMTKEYSIQRKIG